MAGIETSANGSVWERLVGNLHVWKQGSERAPYEPLLVLMLLARAQHGGPNRVAFREVDRPLHDLMEEFGPPRGSYSPELPFWHLRSDQFWEIEDSERLPRRKGKDRPLRSAFVRDNPVGYVPAALWQELVDDRALIARLGRCILEEFWPETYHESILAAVGLDVSSEPKRQPRDADFRELILRAYERRCAFCGHDARLGNTLMGLDAAHIRWHAYQGPDSVRNGLALCALHHVTFDRGAIGLDEQLRVCVSQDLTGQDMVRTTILSFHGRRMLGPQSQSQAPDADFIRWHRKWVFREPAREMPPEGCPDADSR
jgi:putative restriction endonuclease